MSEYPPALPKAVFVVVLVIGIQTLILINRYGERNEAYEGRIESKYINHGSHGTESIKLEGGSSTKFYRDVPFQSLFDAIDPGDYIIKREGTKQYVLVKGNDTTIYKQ